MREAIAALSLGKPEFPINGRFVPCHRNRPLGSERVLAARSAAGGLRIEAATTLDLPRVSLRQKVIADYDARLRPVSCTMTARINGREVRLEVLVGSDRAITSVVHEGRRRGGSIALDRPPLLLVDNCFALHALAGLTAADGAGDDAAFRSIPASEVVKVTTAGVAPLSLGGRDFGVPSVTLILAREYEEHVWLGGGWVTRLLIPQAHMGAEWVPGSETRGGCP